MSESRPTIGPQTPGGEVTITHLTPNSAARAVADVPNGVPADLVGHPRYRVTTLLGEGGMGAVWRAEHLVMDRPVALKVIHPRYTADPATVERFRQEVRTAARLHHPHIVTAFDAEQAGSTHFLVMEYVEGADLGTVLAQRGRLPVGEACRYAWQAALGLQHAHERGLVHRDIKPSNLMRAVDGTVKILDFGLARFARSPDSPVGQMAAVNTANRPDLTAAGAVMGTPDYIAPEQATDAATADVRADIYSLGCTLFHLLTGEPPFAGETVTDRVFAHIGEPPRVLSEVRPDVPAGLSDVVARMMAKDPRDRHQTPAEAADALLPYTDPAGGDAPSAVSLDALGESLKEFELADDPPKPSPWPLALVGAGVVVVVAVVVVLLRWLTT